MSEDIPVNPALPEGFDCTPNGERPASHQEWWFRPYIVPARNGGYMVRCLDGGAWGRSTNMGKYETLEAAVQAARELSERYAPHRGMTLKEALFDLWHKNVTIVDLDKNGNLTARPMTPDDVQI